MAELEVFSPDEAVAFLLARSNSTDEQAAAAVAELLGWLPLALEQAGAYIRETRLPMSAYLDRLRAEPGIVVTESSQRDGKFYVTGLRDPLAADPQTLLAEAGIDPVRVVGRWAPYQALDAEFVLARLKTTLDLPPTTTVRVPIAGRSYGREGRSERRR